MHNRHKWPVAGFEQCGKISVITEHSISTVVKHSLALANLSDPLKVLKIIRSNFAQTNFQGSLFLDVWTCDIYNSSLLLCELPWAAIAQYHRLSYQKKNNFLTVLEAQHSKIQVLANSVSR